MKTRILIVLIFTVHLLQAQNGRVERAAEILRSKPEKEFVLALNDSSFDIRFRESELALQFARYALPYALKTGDKHLEATTLFNIGTAFHIIGIYDSALYYYQRSEPFFISSNNAKSIGTVYLQVALLYSDSENEEQALAYNYKSLNYFQKAKDTVNLIGAMFNMGVYYSDFDSVLSYQTRGLKLLLGFKNIEPEMKAQKLSIAYTNLGNTYQRQGKFNEAIYYYKLAIEQDDRHGDVVYKIASYENLGSCYQQMHEPRKAIAVIKLALLISNGVKGYRTRDHLYDVLAYAYKDLKMYDSAFYALREYTLIKDSINNVDRERILTEMQEKYDSNKKAIEIELLNKDKEAANTFKRAMYVVIGLILIVVIVLIYSYVLKQRSNKKLVLKNEQINRQKNIIEHQKQEVEIKQKEIIDSIHYAKRIQQSLMPSVRYISKKMNDLKK